MTVTGSSIVNTSSNGQPSDNEDRPFSYAIGTQIFLNPVDSPTEAVVEFTIDPNLLNGSVSSGTSNLAIGFATDAELSTLSGWNESYISSSTSPNRFSVGFGRLSNATSKISVNVDGVSRMTLARPQVVSSIDTGSNTLSINAHPFNTGDRVTVTSSGDQPQGLLASTSYYVVNSTVNGIKLASTYAGATQGSEIDIQSTGSGTITVASNEVFTLSRNGSGQVNLLRGDVAVASFSQSNSTSPLRLFYWCREQSASSTDPIISGIKVRGAV